MDRREAGRRRFRVAGRGVQPAVHAALPEDQRGAGERTAQGLTEGAMPMANFYVFIILVDVVRFTVHLVLK